MFFRSKFLNSKTEKPFYNKENLIRKKLKYKSNKG